MHEMFKKLAAYLLIITLVSMPLISAFGQSFTCNNVETEHSIEGEKNTITADHSCCEKPAKKLCTHCDECDCEHAQGGLNIVSFDNNDVLLSASISFGKVSYSFQISNTLNALYRPPRNLL